MPGMAKWKLLEMGGGVRIGSVRFPDMLMTGFITRIWDGLMPWEISRKVFGYGQEKEVGYGQLNGRGPIYGSIMEPVGYIF